MAEVRRCPSTSCPLWRYRMGHEENDDLKPVRKNSDLFDDFEDEDLGDDLTLLQE
jgi:hypothetical protein